MARRVIEVGLALAFIATLWVQSSAQSSACTPVITSLMPCLSYITGNSSTPSASCCTQLSTVVQTQAQCLCTLLNGGAANIGLNINQTQALTLPGACNVQTPPLSQCNAATGPATAPADAPSTTTDPSTAPAEAPSTTSDPSTPSLPSNPVPSTPSVPSSRSTPSATSGGSKAVPASGQSSDGISNQATNTMAFAVLFVAAYVSSFMGI